MDSHTNYDKTIELMNANNEASSDQGAVNLLTQIKKHHANKASIQASLLTRKTSSASNNSNKSSLVSSKDAEADEASENNLATLTIAALKLLNQLEIKFPGKTNEQTKSMLNKVSRKVLANMF
jgi:hypothetical protein